MGHSKPSSPLIVLLALMVMLACGVYTYNQSYFFRFIPLPISVAHIVNDGNWLLPSSQMAEPLGDIDLGDYDIQTDVGL